MLPPDIFIIAHEPLASALKTCAQHIFSNVESNVDQITAIDIPSDVDTRTFAKHLQNLVQRKLTERGILIFTDIRGATPANLAHKVATYPNICVISGVNLPALITAINQTEGPIRRFMLVCEGAIHSSVTSMNGRRSSC